MFERSFWQDRSWNGLPELSSAMHDGKENMAARSSHEQNCAVCGDNLAKINMIYHFYALGQLEYSSIDKMAKYDWNTFCNYVAFLAVELAPGTRQPHHDSESSSYYHDAFLPWGHYHNNIVLFYHDSPITRSHFMDPTDRAIKGFYCICIITELCISTLLNYGYPLWSISNYGYPWIIDIHNWTSCAVEITRIYLSWIILW